MKDVLSIDDLCVIRDGRAVLDGVDLRMQQGEICVVMGPSGAGKSTLLRAVAALEPFDAGSIHVGDFALRPGRIPAQSALRTLRSRVGMVFQGHALFEHMSIIDNVMLAPVHALGWSPDRAREVAHRLLEAMGIASRANAVPSQVSGGEAQRAAIARALATDPALLLMDEPTAALDQARRTNLAETLRDLAADGRSLLVVTHDADFAAGVATRVLNLEAGTLTARPRRS